MPKIRKNMNEVFGRRAVNTSEPDAFWPLQNELVGVEIEVEDLEGNANHVLPEWTIHPDQSLRNGTEFVTSGPMGGRKLTQAIDKFFAAGYKYSMSPRTSTHIHVNASDNMTVDQFRNLFAIMYLVEPAVFRWADENRKWCGYCSPLTDLDPYRIISILNENNNDRNFIVAVKGANNSDRYYGLNVAAYNKHGTVEFRYFPCTDNRDVLVSWIKFTMYVKKIAMAFDEPATLLAGLTTREGVQQFIAANFGDVAQNIGGNLDFDDCVQRAKDLRGMLGVTPDQVKAGEGYKSQRSKGFTKFLARTFPQAVSDDPAAELANAQRRFDAASAELERAMASYPFNRDEAMAAINKKSSAERTLNRLREAQAAAAVNPAVEAAEAIAPAANTFGGWRYAAGQWDENVAPVRTPNYDLFRQANNLRNAAQTQALPRKPAKPRAPR